MQVSEGSEAPLGFKALFYRRETGQEEETLACLHELWSELSARQSVIRKHFSRLVCLPYKRYVTLPPRAEILLPRSCLAKKSPPARLQEVTHFMLQNTSLPDTHAPSLASSLAFCFL